MAAEEIHNQMTGLKFRIETLARDYFGPDFCEDAKDYALSHPFIITAIGLISLFSAIPVAFFLGFAFLTVFFAVLCFICIEGSLIIFAGIILIGVVSFITIITVGMTSVLAVAYWSAQRIHRTFCGNMPERNHRPRVLHPELNRNNRNSQSGRSVSFQNCEEDQDVRTSSPIEDPSATGDSAENYEVVG